MIVAGIAVGLGLMVFGLRFALLELVFVVVVELLAGDARLPAELDAMLGLLLFEFLAFLLLAQLEVPLKLDEFGVQVN